MTWWLWVLAVIAGLCVLGALTWYRVWLPGVRAFRAAGDAEQLLAAAALAADQPSSGSQPRTPTALGDVDRARAWRAERKAASQQRRTARLVRRANRWRTWVDGAAHQWTGRDPR